MNFQRHLHPQRFFIAPESGPVPTIKLSEAIREGDKIIPENHFDYSYCAVGTAYYGKTGEILNKRRFAFSPSELRQLVADIFGVPYDLVTKIDFMHQNGRSRIDIANYLESINQ